MVYASDTQELEMVDVDVEEHQIDSPLQPDEETQEEVEEFEFDFSKITAGDVVAFRKLKLRMQTSRAVELISPSFVNPPDGIDKPGQMKFTMLKALQNSFLKASLTFEADGGDMVRFNVEDIIGDDVDAYVLAANSSNVEKQVEIMDRYAVSRHKDAKDLLALDYETFLSVRATFMDRLLDLTKN